MLKIRSTKGGCRGYSGAAFLFFIWLIYWNLTMSNKFCQKSPELSEFSHQNLFSFPQYAVSPIPLKIPFDSNHRTSFFDIFTPLADYRPVFTSGWMSNCTKLQYLWVMVDLRFIIYLLLPLSFSFFFVFVLALFAFVIVCSFLPLSCGL